MKLAFKSVEFLKLLVGILNSCIEAKLMDIG